MAVLPWVNLPENKVPELLGSIGDTLVSAADKKREDKRRAAEMLLRQQEAGRLDRLATGQLANYASEDEARKANEARIAAGEKRQTGLDVAGAIPKLKSMLTPGSADYDPESAMSLARAHGIDLQRQMPTAPVRPEVGPTAVEQGPRISPEDAQQAGLITAQQNVPGDASPQVGAAEDSRQIAQAEAERKRFEQANDPAQVGMNQQREQDYTGAMQKFRSTQPTYSGTSPIGPVSIDPNSALEARRFAQERTRGELSPLVQSVPEKYRQTIQMMIASGNYDAKAIQAAITEAQRGSEKDQAEENKKAHAQQYELTAEQKYRIGMTAARAKATASGEGIDPSAVPGVAGVAQAGGSQQDVIDAAVAAGATKPIAVGHKLMEQTDKQQQEQVHLDGKTYRVPSGRGGAVGFSKQDADYGRAIEQLQSLLGDAKNGRALTPEDAKRRSTLYENAVGGVATVSPLGKNEESINIERGAIGPSGTPMGHSGSIMGTLQGPNPEAIQRKINEIQKQRERYREETLLPVQGNPLTAAAGAKPKKSNPLFDAADAKKGKQESPADRADRLAKMLGVQ